MKGMQARRIKMEEIFKKPQDFKIIQDFTDSNKNLQEKENTPLPQRNLELNKLKHKFILILKKIPLLF